MELSQLRYFCDVAETEHVTQSAKRLNIVQPALSRSLHKLEEELGVALFEHVGRNIRLTPEGSFLYDRASDALERLDSAVEDLQVYAEQQKRTVRAAVLSATALTVDVIADYVDEDADATFELAQRDDLRWDIRVDTRLCSPSRSDISGCVQERACFTEEIGVAVPCDSEFRDPVSLEDLANERFICLKGSRRFREICDILCSRHGFSPVIGFDSDNPAVVKKIIGLGLGVGFWPEKSWGTLKGSNARWVSLAEKDFERELVIDLNLHVQSESAAYSFYKYLVKGINGRWKQGESVKK